MKIAKIIATSFSPGAVRDETTLNGNPPFFSLHSQNFKNIEEIKKLILFNIQKENESDPGLPVDLVFVNNNVGSVEGNEFVDKLNNKKLKNGKIIVIQNDNYGWSYGAFSRGFKELKDKYDYFIFTEVDVIVAKNNYAKISLETFNHNINCGFVAYWGITFKLDEDTELVNDNQIHAHGASGFSSKKVLEKVYNKYGKLPHSELTDKRDYDKIIKEGEVKFTNVIHKMGYLLTMCPQKLFNPAYDSMRGINKPLRPNKFQEYKWFAKKYLMRKSYKFILYLKLDKIFKSIKKKIFNF